jgi:membrane-bound ClpP family serine protease
MNMVPNIRTLAPRLVVAGVLPVIGYSLLRPHVGSDATALAAVMVFPIGDILFERKRHGAVDPIGMIALIGIALGIVSAVALHGNTMLLKIRESVFTGIFGGICLGSLLARRPAMFYMGRLFATGNDPEKMAEFEGVWDLPGSPRRFRFVTAVWGVALVAEAVLRTFLAVVVSTQRFLELAPVINWTVLGGLLVFTTRYVRSAESAVLSDLEVEG